MARTGWVLHPGARTERFELLHHLLRARIADPGAGPHDVCRFAAGERQRQPALQRLPVAFEGLLAVAGHQLDVAGPGVHERDPGHLHLVGTVHRRLRSAARGGKVPVPELNQEVAVVAV